MFSTILQPIHTDGVREVLEDVLSRYFEAPTTIRRFYKRRSAYASSYALDNIELELNHGLHLSLIRKDLSPGGIKRCPHYVRPRLLYQPQREIEVYERLLDPRLGPPICYGSFTCRESQEYWLFLERVAAKPLWQFGRLDLWKETARWLARWQNEASQTVADIVETGRPDWLLRYNADYFENWLRRAELFLDRRGRGVCREVLRRFARLMAGFDRLPAILEAIPEAFLHGEFYPSNVLIRSADSPERICPIDWETAGIGPAVLDLAALTSGKWDEGCKRAMVEAYRAAIEPGPGWPLAMPELLRAVDGCQLLLAVQWLGWAEAWSPPVSHAQNWLEEALRLAARIGIVQ